VKIVEEEGKADDESTTCRCFSETDTADRRDVSGEERERESSINRQNRTKNGKGKKVRKSRAKRTLATRLSRKWGGTKGRS